MKSFLINRNFFLSLFLALFFAIVLTWPGFLHLNTEYIGDGGDNYEYASYQSLAAERIESGLLPFGVTDFWRFPVGFDFSRGFDSYITVSTGALLKLFFDMPLSYNLTIYFLLTLNGVLSYLFFYRLTKSKILSLMGMLMYAFSFYTIGKAGSHPNLLFTGGISLFFLSILRLFQEETHSYKEYVLFFTSLLIVALGSSQYLLMVLVLSPLFLLTTFLFYRAETLSFVKKLRIKALFVSGWIFSAFFLIAYLPHIRAFLSHLIVFLDRKEILYNFTPSIFEFIFPNAYLKLLIGNFAHSQSAASIEKVVFIGFIELLIFIVFIIYSLIKQRKNYLYLITLFLIPFALSLGYGKDNSFSLLPYRFLSDIFPFSLIPEAGRYYIFFYLFLTVIVILFLKNLNFKYKNALLGLIILFLFIERLPTSFYLSPSLQNQNYQNAAKIQESKAVLDLPIDFYYAPYDIFSFSYDKPIVNGYFHWSADGNKEKSFILKGELLSRYICSDKDPIQFSQLNTEAESLLDLEMISLLKNEEIKTVVIHKDNKFFHDVCRNVRKRLNNLFSFPLALEDTGTNQKQITKQHWEGKSVFSYYFPYDGVFNLDGVYIAPGNRANFNISIDNIALSNYYWDVKENNSMELIPKYTISLPVKSGSTISFYSSEETANTYFSLWYRYLADNPLSQRTDYQPPFETVFEDDNALVLQLK